MRVDQAILEVVEAIAEAAMAVAVEVTAVVARVQMAVAAQVAEALAQVAAQMAAMVEVALITGEEVLAVTEMKIITKATATTPAITIRTIPAKAMGRDTVAERDTNDRFK